VPKATGSTPSEDRKTALRQAYGEATTKLREAHRDEFNDLYAAAAKKHGVDWSPRPTEEQQAEALFDDLLTRFPALRDRVGQEGATE